MAAGGKEFKRGHLGLLKNRPFMVQHNSPPKNLIKKSKMLFTTRHTVVGLMFYNIYMDMASI